MLSRQVVWAGEDANSYTRYQLGGKGINLLRLYEFGKSGLVTVPTFFIVPTDIRRGNRATRDRETVFFYDDEVAEPFSRLRKPVMVRSSSPLEDGVRATFAGMFDSIHDVNSYDDFGTAAHQVYRSVFRREAERYATRMGIVPNHEMALIVQEQVTDFLEKLVIQLEQDRALTEETDKQGRTFHHETSYEFLDEMFAKERSWRPTDLPKNKDFLAEVEYHYVVLCAREAKKRLGLDGVVQVEVLLAPSKLPYFVQIRELPPIRTLSAELNLEIPKGAVYIESDVCNEIPGEVCLPAYVTISQTGIRRILIETGQAFLIGIDRLPDERMKKFYEQSKLAQNHDFNQLKDIAPHHRMVGIEELRPFYNRVWRAGNALFNEYVLVCDKLEETVVGMTEETTNKKAIITCLEASQTSHAFTVARDLGIMAMGVDGRIDDMDYFFNKIETGDLVRMKSDGRRAVAYIERRRERDPYMR